MDRRQDDDYFSKSSAFDVEEKNGGTLSPRVSISRPSSPLSPRTSPPTRILLALWPGASQEQINYYVDGYAAVYPSARVILLRPSSSIDQVLHDLDGDREKPSPPLDHPQPTDPTTLIHLFGHEAATQLCRLLRAHRLRTTQALDTKAIILDSIPVVIAPSAAAIKTSPSLLPLFLYATLCALFWRLVSVLTLWFAEPYAAPVRRDLHDPAYVPADARQCYIFPEKDVMFAWDRPSGVEGEECERKDFRVRRSEVGARERWTGDQERYWLGVENAWEGK